MNRQPPQGSVSRVEYDKIARIRGSQFGRALISTLKEGARSCVINVLGDSLGNESTEWVSLFAQKLASKYPTYNVKYALYNSSSGTYDAWNNLVTTGGAERHVLFASGKVPLQLAKADVPVTSPDLDVSIRFSMDAWSPASNAYIVSRYGGAGARCWYLEVGTDHRFKFYWSADGTNLTGADFYDAQTSGLTNGQAYWYRVTLDVDDGAGHYVAKIYNSADGVTWSLVQTITGGSTTSIYDHASQVYELGGFNGSTSWAGKVYEVRIRNGIDGYIVNPQPIEAWNENVTDANNGGHVGGASTIYVYNASVGGFGIASFTTDVLSKAVKPSISPFVFVALSKNDGYSAGATYLTNFGTLITGIKALATQANLCIIAEPPNISPAEAIVAHSKRVLQQKAYARNNGMDFIDVYNEFVVDSRGVSSLLNADGVHPNSAGEQLIADTVWNYVNVMNV